MEVILYQKDPKWSLRLMVSSHLRIHWANSYGKLSLGPMGLLMLLCLIPGTLFLQVKILVMYGESFKSPADTILPTQVLEIGGMLSSRQAEGNYSKGRFQIRLVPDGNLVLNTFNLETNTEYDAYY